MKKVLFIILLNICFFNTLLSQKPTKLNVDSIFNYYFYLLDYLIEDGTYDTVKKYYLIDIFAIKRFFYNVSGIQTNCLHAYVINDECYLLWYNWYIINRNNISSELVEFYLPKKKIVEKFDSFEKLQAYIRSDTIHQSEIDTEYDSYDQELKPIRGLIDPPAGADLQSVPNNKYKLGK